MNNPRKNKLLPFVFIVVIVIGAAFTGYQFGTNKPKIVIVKGVDNVENDVISNSDFGIFWQTWELLKSDYLKADEVKNDDLILGAAAGLADALNDPYTVFLPPAETKKFNDDISGSFTGIGAEIGFRGDFVVVVTPLKNSPAEKSGLRAGDKVFAVDEKNTSNLGLEEIVDLIRGPRNSQVVLTVLSNGDEKPRDVKIIRDTIKIPTLEWEMSADNLAHLHLFNFNDVSPSIMAKALNEILSNGGRGVVLDLRNNPGGFLHKAVEIAGFFIEKDKTIVVEEFSSGKKNNFNSNGNATLKDFPMVILVNKGSASASEILAGALRDHNNTTIIGETTFGKGTVQELKNLSGGSTLKLTVAHWILPKGDLIDGIGIKPDIEVQLTTEDFETDRDPQLDKALEVLKSKIK